jgi:hypothetical protein
MRTARGASRGQGDGGKSYVSDGQPPIASLASMTAVWIHRQPKGMIKMQLGNSRSAVAAAACTPLHAPSTNFLTGV